MAWCGFRRHGERREARALSSTSTHLAGPASRSTRIEASESRARWPKVRSDYRHAWCLFSRASSKVPPGVAWAAAECHGRPASQPPWKRLTRRILRRRTSSATAAGDGFLSRPPGDKRMKPGSVRVHQMPSCGCSGVARAQSGQDQSPLGVKPRPSQPTTRRYKSDLRPGSASTRTDRPRMSRGGREEAG